MSTLAHILSGSYIAIASGNIDPSQTHYIIAAVVSAGILDADHLFSIVKDRKMYKEKGYSGNLHNARTLLHELMGYAFISALALAVSFFDAKMGYVIGVAAMVHLAEDMLMGYSVPFNPMDRTKIKLVTQRKSIKILVDVCVIVLFGLLWIKFLNA